MAIGTIDKPLIIQSVNIEIGTISGNEVKGQEYPMTWTKTPSVVWLGHTISTAGGGGLIIKLDSFGANHCRLVMYNTRTVDATGVNQRIYYIL